MRPPIDQGCVLITGASSGIGEAMARQLAGRAARLILVARREDRLRALHEELRAHYPRLEVDVRACDLCDRAASAALIDELLAQGRPVDVLINNAGFGDLSAFESADWDKTERMIEVNVRALVYLTRRLVPGMVQRRRGGVLNISSGWGLTFGPSMPVYIATKHFVTGFTESLRLDLLGTGVVVSQSCPGPVLTEFNDVLGNSTGLDMPGLVKISAARCARESLAAFSRGRALFIPGWTIWALTLLGEFTPRPIRRLLFSAIARLLRRRQGRTLAQAAP